MPQSTRAEDLLVTLMETTEDALLTFTLGGTVETWSHGAEQLYGYSAEEMVGRQLAGLLPVFEVAVRETLKDGEKPGASDRSETIERLHKNGSRISVIVKRAAIRGPDGKITGILERGRGLNRSEAEDATDTPGEAQLRMLIEQLPVMLWTADRELRITSNWGSGFLGSQIDAGALVGKTIFEYMGCHDPKAMPIAEHYEALRGTSVRFELRQKNQVLDIRMEPLRGGAGEIIGCIGVGLDITVRKKSEEQIRYQAHDALTGLANYREFMETLQREVRRADRSQHSFALLLLDLDELKHINDRLGHLAGNRALERLAAVMKQHCRATDLAARYGGDEFALLLIDADPAMAEHIAERIEGCVSNDRGEPRLSVSIGRSVYPDDGRTTQELLEAADQRLYRRKKNATKRSVTAT